VEHARLRLHDGDHDLDHWLRRGLPHPPRHHHGRLPRGADLHHRADPDRHDHGRLLGLVGDRHPDSLANLAGLEGFHLLEGDATDDEVLREAGIMRAAGIAAALPNDKDNLFLVVSAKQLRPDLRVASLATDQALCSKLNRAGADSVVAASHIGGLRLASELLRPAVVSFLDLMLRQDDSQVRFSQVKVGPRWAGKTVGDLDAQGTEGLPVLALRPPGGGAFVFNPTSDAKLAEGTEIVTMGAAAKVLELMSRVGDPETPSSEVGEVQPSG
jgi:voltage-gated potassium channel